MRHFVLMSELANVTEGHFMKLKKKLFVLTSPALLAMSGLAFAAGSVIVNGYTFYCQNSCIVTQTSSGLFVSDSEDGWVRMYSPYKNIPVPN